VTDQGAADEFSKYGNIVDLKVKNGGKGTKQLLIKFGTRAEAEAAKEATDR
jgi:hypothetical protein